MRTPFFLTLGRSLAFLLMVYVPTFVLVSAFVMARARTAADEEATAAIAVPLVMVLSLAIALLLIARISRGRFAPFGFRTVGAKSLLIGLGLGIGCGILLRWLSTALNVQQSEPLFAGLGGWQLVAFFWLLAPLQEEVIFRGLLQTTLQGGIPSRIPIASRKLSVAALLTAIVFALVHFALLGMGASIGASALIVIGALVLGLAAGHMRWTTESLIPAIVIHASFNVMGSL